jgi:hypothetical protein
MINLKKYGIATDGETNLAPVGYNAVRKVARQFLSVFILRSKLNR